MITNGFLIQAVAVFDFCCESFHVTNYRLRLLGLKLFS
jgi:hypothetical protein